MTTKDDLREQLAGKTVPELAQLLTEAKVAKEEADKVRKQANEYFDLLRLEIIPDKMEEIGVSSMRIKGLGTLSTTADAYVSVKSGMKEELHAWLIANGFESFITEQVNSSTLKAFVKEQDAKGNPIPDDSIINYTPFLRASVTKR